MEKELPGALEHAIAVSEGKWPHTTDAVAWADNWLAIITANPNIPTCRETMIGWFANAIMAGYDTARLRAAQEALLEPAQTVGEG